MIFLPFELSGFGLPAATMREVSYFLLFFIDLLSYLNYMIALQLKSEPGL